MEGEPTTRYTVEMYLIAREAILAEHQGQRKLADSEMDRLLSDALAITPSVTGAKNACIHAMRAALADLKAEAKL